MRNRLNMAAIVLIVLTSAAASANGQMRQEYRAEIPFDFSIGKTDLKAGKYALGMFNTDSTSSVLGIMSLSGKSRTVVIKPVLRNEEHPNARAVLTFIRTGGHYDLAAVKGSNFSTKLKRTWEDVRQVAKAAPGDSETVNIYLY